MDFSPPVRIWAMFEGFKATAHLSNARIFPTIRVIFGFVGGLSPEILIKRLLDCRFVRVGYRADVPWTHGGAASKNPK
jgi:hypothetical protein